jgi:hypothetical protein
MKGQAGQKFDIDATAGYVAGGYCSIADDSHGLLGDEPLVVKDHLVTISNSPSSDDVENNRISFFR